MLKDHARYCDANGVELLGTDSLIWIDGRWNQRTRDQVASRTKESYKANFPSKYAAMSHYVYRGAIRKVT